MTHMTHDMIEMAKAFTTVFMKAKKIYWLSDEERNVSIEIKSQDGGNIFFKTLANRFRLKLKLTEVSESNKDIYGLPSTKWTS